MRRPRGQSGAAHDPRLAAVRTTLDGGTVGFGRWGRGPTTNGEACTDCHANGTRCTAAQCRGAVAARRAAAERARRELVLPHPPTANRSVSGCWAGCRARPRCTSTGTSARDAGRWHARPSASPAHPVGGARLRRVELDSLLSLHMAPALAGMGLLEAVSVQTLQRIAVGQSARVSGATNARRALAQRPSALARRRQVDLHTQVASALHADQRDLVALPG